jgi:hypothetical protein
MRAPVIAVAIAAGLGAGPSACTLADNYPIRDTAPALEGVQPRMVEFAGSQRNPAPASNASATAGIYFRWHADVSADATIAGLPGRAMIGGAAAGPAKVDQPATSRVCPVLSDLP